MSKSTTDMKSNEMKVPGTGLNSKLVERAVQALLKHHDEQAAKVEKKSLLGTDRPFQVQLTLHHTPRRRSPKPIRVMIPNPLFQVAENKDGEVDEPEVCFIVKEEAKPDIQEMIQTFPKYMSCIKKVLGLQSLRKKHAQYEQRRELLRRYNVFLADDRILPMLSKALGRDFYKMKKLPIPIDLTRKEALPFAIQKALSATFMTINGGNLHHHTVSHANRKTNHESTLFEARPLVVIKFVHSWSNFCSTLLFYLPPVNDSAGHTGMEPKKLIENVLAIAGECCTESSTDLGEHTNDWN